MNVLIINIPDTLFDLLWDSHCNCIFTLKNSVKEGDVITILDPTSKEKRSITSVVEAVLPLPTEDYLFIKLDGKMRVWDNTVWNLVEDEE
jgi:hypothetical protein